ncbi:diaminopimelate epimerase [Desulfonauticus submarinus]|uniref:Diaminopimelate epimerase n=1 Tax=Desulfonauticus submarinus TaxID=206665 RepID=A0A1H0A7R9_9BACT|nr:diaminopimelate epimerase [Desulfonauticus submarinus]SDN29271.1 diaminopimelate epimerase [Desulfonauticus submarinus]
MDLVFYKMQGSGNDFILFDLNSVPVNISQMSAWAKKLCQRCFGVGADGLIFLEEVRNGEIDFKWHFYNADGTKAEMCGNGARCAAWLANYLGLAGKEQAFLTEAGVIHAEIVKENEVKVELTEPKDLKLDVKIFIDENDFNIHYVNTGVPHVVFFTENIKEIDVNKIGRRIRFHDYFSPSGSNVNFVQIVKKDFILLRTYERGVENETYACGTGAAASVYVGFALGLLNREVNVVTSGGEKLKIFLQGERIFLQGKTILVYKGFLNKKILENI